MKILETTYLVSTQFHSVNRLNFTVYSSVPNRRAVRNKRAGGKILKKTLNVQDRIDVQGENFSAKSIIVQGENKRAGGN